nr:MAG TPA: hypothetical protein [Caudoviricetes sp.]
MLGVVSPVEITALMCCDTAPTTWARWRLRSSG